MSAHPPPSATSYGLHSTPPKAGIVPLTQGRLKTLLQPHSLQGGCPPQSTQVQSAEEGAAESAGLLQPLPEVRSTWTVGKAAVGSASS